MIGFDLNRRRWASVVGKGLIRLNPRAEGRSGNSSPSRISTYFPNEMIFMSYVGSVGENDSPGGLRSLLNITRDAEIRARRDAGEGAGEIAVALHVSRRTVFRILESK